MKVIAVDLTRCQGHGKCYALAPDLFSPFDDHGHSEFTADAIGAADTERIKRGERAILECPEEALSWTPDSQQADRSVKASKPSSNPSIEA
jgi:ferredoxin